MVLCYYFSVLCKSVLDFRCVRWAECGSDPLETRKLVSVNRYWAEAIVMEMKLHNEKKGGILKVARNSCPTICGGLEFLECGGSFFPPSDQTYNKLFPVDFHFTVLKHLNVYALNMALFIPFSIRTIDKPPAGSKAVHVLWMPSFHMQNQKIQPQENDGRK